MIAQSAEPAEKGREDERWRLFLKQYHEWREANVERLDKEGKEMVWNFSLESYRLLHLISPLFVALLYLLLLSMLRAPLVCGSPALNIVEAVLVAYQVRTALDRDGAFWCRMVTSFGLVQVWDWA